MLRASNNPNTPIIFIPQRVLSLRPKTPGVKPIPFMRPEYVSSELFGFIQQRVSSPRMHYSSLFLARILFRTT